MLRLQLQLLPPDPDGREVRDTPTAHFERFDVAVFVLQAARAKSVSRTGSCKWGRVRVPRASPSSRAVRCRQFRKLERSVAERMSRSETLRIY